MLVEAWLQRAAPARGERVAVETPAGELDATPSSCGRARPAPASWPSAACGAGERVAIALAGRARLRPGAARLPAAGGGRGARRPAPVGARARARRARRADGHRRAAAPDAGDGGAALASRARARRGRARDPHLGHDRRAASRRADLRQPAVERARLGRRARGSTRGERWLCALPLAHVGGLSILLRSAIYGTTAVVHERFETERVLRRAAPAAPSRSSASSRPRSRGCSTPGSRSRPGCAARSRAAARCPRPWSSARTPPAYR